MSNNVNMIWKKIIGIINTVNMIWKKTIGIIFNKLGYELIKLNDTRGAYTICQPYGYFTYSPWFEKWFQEKYSNIKNNTLVTEDRCYMIYRFVQHCLNLEGDLAECGVFKGGSAYLIADTMRCSSASDKYLHVFDSFVGMPNTAVFGTDRHKEGDFGDVSIENVKRYLSDFKYVKFHQGFIPKTFKSEQYRKFSFVHIDVDIYQTTMDCCQFFYSRMVPGGVMIFDEYGRLHYKFAEKKAVDEFFMNKPEKLISLHTGQCFFIKL
jgi:hypothetical protein